MISSRQIVGVVLAILAILGASMWLQVVGTYVAVSDAQLNLPGHVDVIEVRVPKLASEELQATVGVLVRVENPSAIAIVVFSITYRFYMDNLTDTRSFWEKAEDILVGNGGFYKAEGGYEVPAGQVRELWANLTIDGERQPAALERLNNSFGGRYYPILLATLQYRFPGTSIAGSVRGLSFSTLQGVLSYED